MFAHTVDAAPHPQPTRVAATKLGSFFKRIFQKPVDTDIQKTATSDGTESTPTRLPRFSHGQMEAAIKQALGKGLNSAITQLGRTGGFFTNNAVRIPMPERLRKIESGLRRYGQDAIADEFISTMNQAAEKAIPLAAPIFHNALNRMSIEDAERILSGPDDSATGYFRQATSAELTKLVHTKVSEVTSQVGLTSAYKNLTQRLRFGTLFLNYDMDDLDQYVTNEALDSLFTLVAEEERKIRKNQVARTTSLLKSVFGSLTRK